MYINQNSKLACNDKDLKLNQQLRIICWESNKQTSNSVDDSKSLTQKNNLDTTS